MTDSDATARADLKREWQKRSGFSSLQRAFALSSEVSLSLLYLSILSVRILGWLFVLAGDGISVKPGKDKRGGKSSEIASIISR